jgi:spore coat protein U-like protein
VDAATSASVTCTSGTPYKVGLSAGNGVGATTSARKMTRTSAPLSTVSYGLYRDLARSQNWGNDTAGGTDTPSGTGAGTVTSYPIYGRVPPQATPEPGDYLDTIVLSVVF